MDSRHSLALLRDKRDEKRENSQIFIFFSLSAMKKNLLVPLSRPSSSLSSDIGKIVDELEDSHQKKRGRRNGETT